jgi:hypothetical protein
VIVKRCYELGARFWSSRFAKVRARIDQIAQAADIAAAALLGLRLAVLLGDLAIDQHQQDLPQVVPIIQPRKAAFLGRPKEPVEDVVATSSWLNDACSGLCSRPCRRSGHPRHVGMVHQRQRLPLGFEAGQNLAGIHRSSES